jgi:hypothetical protein
MNQEIHLEDFIKRIQVNQAGFKTGDFYSIQIHTKSGILTLNMDEGGIEMLEEALMNKKIT